MLKCNSPIIIQLHLPVNLEKLDVFFLQVYDKNDGIWLPNKEWYYNFLVIYSKYFSNSDGHKFPG